MVRNRIAALALVLATPCWGRPAPAAAPAPGKMAAAPEMPAAPVGGMTIEALRQAIFSKMEYDQHYFSLVLQHKSRGRVVPGMERELFEREVVRARTNAPVLDTFFAERDGYRAGRPFSLPARADVYRVYANLICLLNMVQAAERGDHARVLEFGSHVVIDERRNLGQVVGERADYYVQLYREFFYLMAVANYRTGRDKQAVAWFARLEADTDLKALRQQIEQQADTPADDRAARLAELRRQPVAVMPLSSLADDREHAWVGPGAAEVLTADLAQYTSLMVVERSQLAKVLGEITLAQQGVTEERLAGEVGKVLNAGSMVVGSYRVQNSKVDVALRLVDPKSAAVLTAASALVELEDLAAGLREVVIKLLGSVGWMDPEAESQMRAAHAPRGSTMRSLVEARLLLATKADEARELYANAMKDDPAYASVFADLQAQFSDISATVGIVPFVNVTAFRDDDWMVRGIAEALATDLPKAHFTVVERGRLEALLEERVGAQQAVDNDSAREAAQQSGADFLVMGSFMHLKPQVRLDLRFVEVKTGTVVFSTSAEDGTDDFMAALLALTSEIMRRFNRDLPPDVMAQLAGKRMSKEEFERFVRQRMAQDSIDRSLAGRSRPPSAAERAVTRNRYGVALTAAAGLGSALAAVLAGRYHAVAQEAVDRRNAEPAASAARYYHERAKSLAATGNVLVGLAATLGVVAAGAGGYTIYHLASPTAASGAPP